MDQKEKNPKEIDKKEKNLKEMDNKDKDLKEIHYLKVKDQMEKKKRKKVNSHSENGALNMKSVCASIRCLVNNP